MNLNFGVAHSNENIVALEFCLPLWKFCHIYHCYYYFTKYDILTFLDVFNYFYKCDNTM